ncbi:MAG: RNB domain-containing ribonuclease, partial [Myxococcales bacterium]|nr:RNB domain-containing ribonuclease [Myxococcales bacterium]
MKSIDRNAVLGLLGPRPMHFMEICDRLSVPRKEKDALLALLETLRNEDLAQELPGKRFRAAKKKPVPVQAGAVPETNANEATGRITVHARGFGFLAADDGLGDVFIAPDSVGGALHGDRVRARVEKGSRGREGRVLEVLDRARDKLTGIVRRDGRQFVFLPDDPRMRSPLPIEGKVPPQADGGTTVIARIVSFPRTSRDVPEVAIAEVLGKAGLAAVEVAKLKIRDGVIEPFPAEVLEEARQVPTSVLPEDIAEREDLRHIEFVTIDPPDARDHDDAVWVERLAHGRFRVLVAIADVSHYVRKDTAIDREALARGCTIYLPDRAIPMLPKEISSGMASLVPDVDRLTLGVEVELSKDGVIETSRYFEGVMRSRARLTYGGVARALGWTTEPPADPKAEARIPLLEALSEVSGLLRKRRRARGSLDFDLPEPRVLLEEATGEPIDVYRSREDPGIRKAYAVIEDFMLLANEVVAEDLHRRGMPALYRVHGKPD